MPRKGARQTKVEGRSGPSRTLGKEGGKEKASWYRGRGETEGVLSKHTRTISTHVTATTDRANSARTAHARTVRVVSSSRCACSSRSLAGILRILLVCARVCVRLFAWVGAGVHVWLSSGLSRQHRARARRTDAGRRIVDPHRRPHPRQHHRRIPSRRCASCDCTSLGSTRPRQLPTRPRSTCCGEASLASSGVPRAASAPCSCASPTSLSPRASSSPIPLVASSGEKPFVPIFRSVSLLCTQPASEPRQSAHLNSTTAATTRL